MTTKTSRATLLDHAPSFIYHLIHYPCQQRIRGGELGCPECEDIFTTWQKRYTTNLNPWPPNWFQW